MVVQLNDAPDDRRVGGETPLPETEAQDRDAVVSVRSFARGEDASAHGRRAERREKVRGDVLGDELLRLSLARQIDVEVVEGGDRLEDRRALLPSDEVG